MVLNDQKIKGVVFFGAVISCITAFVNNYPLVFSDTGNYIQSGFEGTGQDERSLFYGLFIRYASLSTSLWYVVLLQGLIISYSIHITLGLFLDGLRRDIVFISCITLLALFTGFSFYTGTLSPDIFMAVSVLAFINLLLNKKLSTAQILLISVLFVFSVSVQYSSLAIFFLLSAASLIHFTIKRLRKRNTGIDLRRLGLATGLVLSCFVIVPIVNYSFAGLLKSKDTKHVFAWNYFIKTGVLDDYLYWNCMYHSYKICEEKKNAGLSFTKPPERPLQKAENWESNKEECKSISRAIISNNHYLGMIVQKGTEASLKQLFTFDVFVSPPQLGFTSTFDQIELRYKNSLRDYYAAAQNHEKVNVNLVNALQPLLVLASLMFLLVTLLSPTLSSRLNFELRATLAIILLHTLFNAIVCSNLLTIQERFQGRIAWLLPLCAVIAAVKLAEAFKSEKSDQLQEN